MEKSFLLNKIEIFINQNSNLYKNNSQTEAKEMGKQIEKSDKLKRVFGARPKSPGSDDEPAQSPTSPNSEVENITTRFVFVCFCYCFCLNIEIIF